MVQHELQKKQKGIEKMTPKEKELLQELAWYKNALNSALDREKEHRTALRKACYKLADMDENLAKIIHGNDTEDYASASKWEKWCYDYE